jgi:hypothetical protein
MSVQKPGLFARLVAASLEAAQSITGPYRKLHP